MCTNHLFRVIWLLSLVAVTILASSAYASISREQLELILSDYERVPAKNQLLHLDANVANILRDIVAHPSSRALARVRAVSLLQQFPATATAELLRSIIQKKNKPTLNGVGLLELQEALISYAVVTGPKSLSVIKPFLNHTDQEVRFSATRAVALSRSSAALELLTRQYRKEPSKIIRHQLEKQIKTLRQKN